MAATELARRTFPRPRLAVRVWPSTWPHVWLGVVFGVVWSTLAVARTVRGEDLSYDTAIFTEAVKGWATHGVPVAPIKGAGFNLLGDHWSPVLVLLAPLWWVWPSALMLQTVQALLFAWSVGVVSLTASEVLGTRAKGLAVGVAYGLSFGLQRAVDAGFHEIAFAVPVVAMVMRLLLRRRWTSAAWWCLPLILVKEDLGLTVAVVGLILMFCRRRWTGAALIITGAAATALEMWWLIPHFAQDHKYAYLAKLPGGGHHLHVGALLLALVWPMLKWQTLGWTLGVVGFACLRSPLLLVGLPTVLWRWESSESTFWDTGWHYSAVLMPVVFIAAVDGWRRLERSRWVWQRQYARQLVPLMVGVAVACTVALPLGVSDLPNAGTYLPTVHEQAWAYSDSLIPPGVSVEADVAQVTVLASRDTVYFDGSEDGAPDYLALDLTWWKPSDDLTGWAASAHHAVYRILWQKDQVVLMQKTG